jgi:hypothetical protein
MSNLPNPARGHSEETDLVAMLGVISAQIQAALQETDAPAATLVETAHAMGKATETVARCIFDFSGSPARVFKDLMVLHDDLHARAGKTATAIQFHDRLVQCLTHVCASLTSLAEFIAQSNGARSAAEWSSLRERIRSMHSMEKELALFDVLSSNASEEEKKTAIANQASNAGVAGKVELF